MITGDSLDSERALVLAPKGRDGSVASAILNEAGIAAHCCTDLPELLTQLEAGAGVALIVEEVLHQHDYPDLVRWIEAQPAWSDFPIVILALRGAGLERNPSARRFIQALGNVSFLERPFHPTTLVSVVRTALRGRRRQYEARDRIETIRQAEARFRAMAESIPHLTWMADRDGRVFWFNRRWYEFTGFDEQAATPSDSRAALHPDHAERTIATYQAAIRSGRPWSETVPLRRRDGAYRWFLADARPFHDDEGHITGWFGANTDVTEQLKAEELLERRVEERTAQLESANRQLADQIAERERIESALRQSQRLEAVGQLTSGVAHDFNNLLMVILGNVRQMQKTAQDDTMTRRLTMMAQAAERGAQLTAQMLAFSRRQKLEPQVVDLNDTVLRMHDLLRSTMGGSIHVRSALQPDLWPALIDPTQIELAILNLAINARDAMAVGGALSVETANVTLGPPERPENPPPGDYVMVAVRDNGCGMTPEVLDRVFEPFFTTKDVGRGSGLGLSQVYGLAKQSGGGVAIDTRPGDGAVVKVYLPRSLAVPAAASPAAVMADDIPPTDHTILVVDDDSAVREVTAAMLEQQGYQVIEAGSGGAALEALDRNAAIDLLLVDFAMPGMNGAEVAREVRARRRHLPVLFVTGYADTAALAEANDDAILRKPFDSDQLAAKLRVALARG
jgi:PAS domain S-box-containing protein